MAGEAEAAVRYGPVVLDTDLTSGGTDVDLDAAAPVSASTLPRGTDLFVSPTTGVPGLDSPGSALTLAPLPGSGPAPTEDECAEAVEDRGTYTVEARRGARFCLTTSEGRTAYLRVLSAPPGGTTPRFEVTVWDPPGA
ncbi:hypothetical protein ACIQ6Y_26905 [Streptomyces sp. NPDC096205]|uniref:hypothetical protein n=1 Tax=Streptomyces sp. NPDC096205 TaxID=3366081 RepID=UPI0037F300CC